MGTQILWDRQGAKVRMTREAFRFLGEVIRRTSAAVAACLRRSRMVIGEGLLRLECSPQDVMLLELMRDGLDASVRAVFGGTCRWQLVAVSDIPARKPYVRKGARRRSVA
ncbi:MAG: hypothetical protein VKO21_09140 [Candidatus Sericytochromatia bacterium]|nr:hypothetical protein [Candidatus Sericytochromatia bacterium]